MSPLHSIVLELIDFVQDKYHVCGMDNLYNSVTFCKCFKKHSRKIKTQVTLKKGGVGIPRAVVHQEVTNIKGQIEVIGTIKESVLKGSTECPDIVASSIYDTITVHSLSMGCNLIKWVIKSNKVYNLDSGEVEHMYFLRLNHIYDYNNTMGVVEI